MQRAGLGCARIVVDGTFGSIDFVMDLTQQTILAVGTLLVGALLVGTLLVSVKLEVSERALSCETIFS